MAGPESPSLPISDIYIDESSQTQHRYLVLGGIILPQSGVAEFTEAIWRARRPELPAGEMKWGKVSRSKLAAYMRVVDLFFAREYRSAPHFHSLVVDTSRLRHDIYNEGDREIGFSKEIYQLAMKCGLLYGGLFHVYPDRRNTSQSPEKVRFMLNCGIRNKGDKRDWPFRRMQFRDSDTVPLLQLADVFSGAIAYRLNGHHTQPGASPAKIALCNHVLNRAGIRDVSRDTNRRGKFTIWHRQLR